MDSEPQSSRDARETALTLVGHSGTTSKVLNTASMISADRMEIPLQGPFPRLPEFQIVSVGLQDLGNYQFTSPGTIIPAPETENPQVVHTQWTQALPNVDGQTEDRLREAQHE